MKKLQVANAKEQYEAIRNEIFRSEESRYDHRLHGLLLVSEGIAATMQEVYLVKIPEQVERWVRQFNEKGFDALKEGKRTGKTFKTYTSTDGRDRY